MRDANGNLLAVGHDVIVFNDLEFDGKSGGVKSGIEVNGIRLVAGDHPIDGKVDGRGSSSRPSSSPGHDLRRSAYRGVMPRLQRLGWILFLVCAVLYTGAGVRDGDPLIVIGSVTFGVACVLFLVDRRAAGGDTDAPGPSTTPESHR